MRAPCAASRLAAARAMSSASGASTRTSTSSIGSTTGATVAAMLARLLPVERERSREVVALAAADGGVTPTSCERGVRDLAAVRDEPLAVDRRELVEVATPVIEPVHGQEEVVGARAGFRRTEHVDLRR